MINRFVNKHFGSFQELFCLNETRGKSTKSFVYICSAHVKTKAKICHHRKLTSCCDVTEIRRRSEKLGRNIKLSKLVIFNR